MSLKDTLHKLVSLGMSIDDAMELVTADQSEKTNEQPTETAAVRRPGRRLIGARVAYVLTEKAKRHMADKKWDPLTDMFNTQALTFSALARRRQPTTAKELEGLTGLVRKTIESTVYHLRNDGWIESVAINGTNEPASNEPIEKATDSASGLAAELRQLLTELKGQSGTPKRRRRRSRKATK